MFERFTDQPPRVVVLAQKETRIFNHDCVGTEHILLGLIPKGEGVAAKALESLGISLDGVRQEVEEIVGQGQQSPSGHIPFTPGAKKVLELSLREALRFGHNYIGTEHLLLAVISEGEGVGARVLVKLGADFGRVRQQVVELLPGQEDKPRGGVGRGPAEPARAAPLSELRARLDGVEARLAAMEQRIGVGPYTSDLDRRIGEVGQEKANAIEAQDFEKAASLREQERELRVGKASRCEEWAGAHPALESLAERFGELSGEVGRLRALLGQHGIEPED